MLMQINKYLKIIIKMSEKWGGEEMRNEEKELGKVINWRKRVR